MNRALAREAVLSAAAAATLAAILAWLGPPGTDLSAHVYQRALFLRHGFTLWNNFWYAGRYSFVTYSVLYYPLAALFGIRLLAVATIAVAALAFAVVLGREWGPAARWSSRTFAIVWAGIVLSAAFPFALGAALALFALWALQSGARKRFAVLAVLTLAASPVAFLFLALVLTGIALARRFERWPLLVVLGTGAVELALWRIFPDDGRFPFSLPELAAVCAFCGLGALWTWRVEQARILRFFFVTYGVACIAIWLVPSAVGENIVRLRFAAIPLAVLAFSLRSWRPRVLVLATFALAISWNVTPLAAGFLRGTSDPAANAAYWRPAISFLHQHLGTSYRVEAVDTAGHWESVYLAEAGIPLTRGWFRQDDFPQNELFYGALGRTAYQAWLLDLGVRYVVLTSGPVDYSAREEAALLAGGHSGLKLVMRTPTISVYEVPGARPLLTGPAPAHVVRFAQSEVVLWVARGGNYRLAVRYSPYWKPSAGCVSRGDDGMIRLAAPAGTVRLRFEVDARGALFALAGATSRVCVG